MSCIFVKCLNVFLKIKSYYTHTYFIHIIHVSYIVTSLEVGVLITEWDFARPYGSFTLAFTKQ